jgi:hypothetical protein
LQPVERNADRRDSSILSAGESFVVEQGSVGDEGGTQSDPGKSATQSLPIWMQQWLAPRDVDVVATELYQLARRAADPFSRKFALRNLAAMAFAVDTAQVAAAGYLEDAGARLSRHSIQWVPTQTKRTPA